MFAKANKAFKASDPPGRNALAKQLLPSSSPSAAPVTDIRDQFKKPSSASPAGAASSARTASFSKPVQDRSSGSSQQQQLQPTSNPSSSGGATGSLASLYNKPDPFKHESGVIDLTQPDEKIKQMVYFAEEDFSDDENLDLDYKAPTALPTLPAPKPQVNKNTLLPPPSATPPPATQQIEWSSSPTSHYFPPKPTQTSTTTTTTTASLKRDSSGESELTGLPVQKKKRKLPASFRAEPVKSESQQDAAATFAPPTKPTRMWEASSNAIEERKKQFKIQQAARAESQGLDEQQPPEFGKTHDTSKGDAIHLSKEQEHVLDLVVNQGKSVFFTGPAGTGKSVLMRAIINQLRAKFARDRERVAVTASTGLAACNIGGITLHSFSGRLLTHNTEHVATLVWPAVLIVWNRHWPWKGRCSHACQENPEEP